MPDDDPRCEVFKANRLFADLSVENSFFDNTLDSRVVAVMRDGIAIATFRSKLRAKPSERTFTPDIEYVDWSRILTVQVAGNTLRIKLVDGDHRWSELSKDNDFHEQFRVYQSHGDIPKTVTLLDPPPPEPRKKDKKENKRGSWWPSVALLVVAVGYPFYVGGGSLFVAVSPGIADIAPSAVEQAISKHPEWSLPTKLKLQVIAAGFAKTPEDVLADLFDLRQNSLQSLWLVPVFWLEKFVPRDKQIELMSEMIEEAQARNANTPRSP